MRLTRLMTAYRLAQIIGVNRRTRMRTRELINRSVFALDKKIGTVKSIEVDSEEWKITHLELELRKEIAESVLGVKKGGVRNMLAVSALKKGATRGTDNGLHIKVSKDQLHMYLRPVVEAPVIQT